MRYLLFTAAWSKPSKDLLNTITNFLPDLQLREVRLEECRQQHDAHGIRRWPTLVEIDEQGRELRRTISADLTDILEFTQEKLNAENLGGNVQQLAQPVSECTGDTSTEDARVLRLGGYVLKRDVVIPAGTVLSQPPRASTRWGRDFEAVVGIDKDHSAYFSISLDEAFEAGLI